ncbi:MAG: pitrilysin family protein [Phycisphaerae bacterium]|jgi:predicted Zn-dependent peptidase
MEARRHSGRLFLSAVVAGAVWVACAHGQEGGAQAGVQPREVVLDNGLTLLLVERHDQPIVACGVFYDVGSVNDPRGKSGIAHLFEHMMFKGSKVIGTTDYQAERAYIEQQDALRKKMIAEMNKMRLMKRRGEIDDVLDPNQWTDEYKTLKSEYDELVAAERVYIKNNELADLYSTNGGAMLNAGTMADLTIYFVQLPANKLELFFWIESDRMGSAVMREFYVERDNVREERRLRVESTPTGKFDEAFEALFWQSHPYGIPVLGWASEVESITREDVRDFYKTYYAPNNARVVLVGDFKTDDAINLAKRYFGRLPRGPKIPEPVITEEPKPIAERRFYAEADTNPKVALRYHTAAMGHRDEAALDVVGDLLSGKTGRLYKRLIAQEDAAIGEPWAGNQGRKYAGYFEVNATVKEGRTPEEVEYFILQEIESLRTGDIAERELQKVKNQVLAASVRQLKRTIGLMFRLGMYDTWYDWTYINEAPKRVMGVTADDVRRVVNEYLDPKTRTAAIYLTKETEEQTDVPPDEEAEFALLMEPLAPEVQERFRSWVDRMQTMEASQLEPWAALVEAAMDERPVPEQQKPAIEYMVRKMRERAEELKAAEEAKKAPQGNEQGE